MKTLFLCCEQAIHQHLDEEYDEILYVSDDITTENIEEWSFRIKDAVRLVVGKLATDADKTIKVVMDCPSPYNWIMTNIKLEMSTNEQIKVILPEMPANPNAEDIIKESQEIAEKIKKAQLEKEQNAKVHGLRGDDGSKAVDGEDN